MAAKRLQLFKRLFTSFAVCPAPAGPTWMTSLGDREEQVLDPLEDLVTGTHHERRCPGLGTAHTAADRRVAEVDVAGCQLLDDLPIRGRAPRRGVDDDGAGLHELGELALTEQQVEDVGGAGQRQEDVLAPCGDLLHAGEGRSLLEKLLGNCRVAVVDVQLVVVDQPARDRGAHRSHADESDCLSHLLDLLV